MMRRLVSLLVAAAALCAAPAAFAQGTGAVRATATILFPPLVANGVRPLQFGTVTPGTPATVQPATPGSGEVRLSGVRNRRSITISFTLPANLVNARGQTMPIDFNGDYAANCEVTTAGVCDPLTYVEWNPVTLGAFPDTPDRARKGRPRYDLDAFSIFIGGIVRPPAAQPAGTYTGTIGVTVAVN
jgi:spore coat protein U-like protein